MNFNLHRVFVQAILRVRHSLPYKYYKLLVGLLVLVLLMVLVVLLVLMVLCTGTARTTFYIALLCFMASQIHFPLILLVRFFGHDIIVNFNGTVSNMK